MTIRVHIYVNDVCRRCGLHRDNMTTPSLCSPKPKSKRLDEEIARLRAKNEELSSIAMGQTARLAQTSRELEAAKAENERLMHALSVAIPEYPKRKEGHPWPLVPMVALERDEERAKDAEERRAATAAIALRLEAEKTQLAAVVEELRAQVRGLNKRIRAIGAPPPTPPPAREPGPQLPLVRDFECRDCTYGGDRIAEAERDGSVLDPTEANVCGHPNVGDDQVIANDGAGRPSWCPLDSSNRHEEAARYAKMVDEAVSSYLAARRLLAKHGDEVSDGTRENLIAATTLRIASASGTALDVLAGRFNLRRAGLMPWGRFDSGAIESDEELRQRVVKTRSAWLALCHEVGDHAGVANPSREETYDRRADWSRRTFGEGDRYQGVIEHIRRELKEIEKDPADLEEWVDVVMLAMDGAWRSAGANGVRFWEAFDAKAAKNEKRKWKAPDADGVVEHDRSEDGKP